MPKLYPPRGLMSRAYPSISLATLREAAADDIQAAAANGGLLAKDTTPILEYASGDADSSLQVKWAAGNQDPVVLQLACPDLDDSQDLEIHLRAKMDGSTDTPVIDADSYINEGDAKISDATSAALSASVQELTITIAAADIPSGAQTLTCELTPGAHATDAMILSALWVEYERLAN